MKRLTIQELIKLAKKEGLEVIDIDKDNTEYVSRNDGCWNGIEAIAIKVGEEVEYIINVEYYTKMGAMGIIRGLTEKKAIEKIKKIKEVIKNV